MSWSALEESIVTHVMAADLPELAGWAIESLGAQVDLEDDQLELSVSTLLIAIPGADLNYPGGDALQVVFAAVVPGSDQTTRRQQALDGLMAIRNWLPESQLPISPNTIRTERLHPAVVMGLFATYIG